MKVSYESLKAKFDQKSTEELLASYQSGEMSDLAQQVAGVAVVAEVRSKRSHVAPFLMGAMD